MTAASGPSCESSRIDCHGSPLSSTAQIADSFLTGVSQDIPIWENKSYNPRPVLTKQEKGILDHREWCKQFYSELA